MERFHASERAAFSPFLHHLRLEMDRELGRELSKLQMTRQRVIRTAIEILRSKKLITSSEEARLILLSEVITTGKMDAERIQEFRQAVAHMLDDAPGEVTRGIATAMGAAARALEAANTKRSS